MFYYSNNYLNNYSPRIVINEPPKETQKSYKCLIILISLIIIIIIGIFLLIYFLVIKKAQDETNNEEETSDFPKNEEEDEGDLEAKEEEVNDENKESEEPFRITQKHRTRISLLEECMKVYEVKNFPKLDGEVFNNDNNQRGMNYKILSVSTLELNSKKGETINIFKNGFELQEEEYACISYELNGNNYMTKIPDGMFYIPDDFNGEISETPFTFILYFNYDPSINDLNSTINDTSLDLLKNGKENKQILLRKLSFFSKVKDFFKKNVETIVEKVIEKTVSYACVSLIKFLFQDFYNVIIKGITEFACDELGEFVSEETTKLIFNSNSKPEEKYKEIIYEESIENNYRTYPKNIFSISYINRKLKKMKDKKYIEIKGDDYNKYASDIIPSEEMLTKHNHIFNPLGNLILAELSSAYLKPTLIGYNFDYDIHFFKQYNFVWTYTDKYDEKNDYININTFLADNKYILFNNMDCDKTNSEYEFYIAIKKIGESRIKIYKNPEFICLSKFSDFKAAFWIRDVKDISSCFKFNNIYHKKPFLSNAVDEYWDTLHYYTYGYKSINMAEYNFSNIYSFKDFITFTSAENIIMPFYSNDNVCDINRFISNNYRLKNINWNEFTIKANHIKEFITYSALEGIDLDMKIIKGAKSLQRFFEFDDLTNNNIKNFDTSQVTEFVGVLANTLGDEIEFVKNWNTSQLITMNHFISNNDIEKLDLSMWNKTRLIDIAFGFYKCRNLKYIDLSGYVKVFDDCNILGLFWGLNSLEAINIKGWDFSSTIFTNINDTCFNAYVGRYVFFDNVLSKVAIYIDEKMYYNYLDTIKKLFKVDNNSQYTTAQWPY